MNKSKLSVLLGVVGMMLLILVIVLMYMLMRVPSIKTYCSIKYYAMKYDVPSNYAFSVAYYETGYRGPFHWGYNPARTSYAAAVGPMQLMPSTANWIAKRKIPVKELRNNISLNVELGLKYLSHLKKKHEDWRVVFGRYNTGRPTINKYAQRVYKGQYKWDSL